MFLMIPERYAIIGLFFSIFVLVIDLYLVKKRRINSSTFVMWLVISVGIGAFSLVPAIYFVVLEIMGTQGWMSAVTAVGFLSLLLILFYLQIMVSELKDKVLKLTAEVAALKVGPKEERKADD